MENKLSRIDKIISNQTSQSRKLVKKMISDGLVTVDDEIVKDSKLKVNPKKSIINVSGKDIFYQKHMYIMMNKPKGVLTASEDKKQPTVMDLIPNSLLRKGMFPAGRLDKDTEGFVFLTTDGDFAHRMLNPKQGIPKTYEALIDKNIKKEDIEKFEDGVETLHGTIFKPAQIKVLESTKIGDLVEIIITEGKYHQIKRMVSSISAKVLELKRVKIGQLELDKTLISGSCREINQEELDLVM